MCKRIKEQKQNKYKKYVMEANNMNSVGQKNTAQSLQIHLAERPF